MMARNSGARNGSTCCNKSDCCNNINNRNRSNNNNGEPPPVYFDESILHRIAFTVWHTALHLESEQHSYDAPTKTTSKNKQVSGHWVGTARTARTERKVQLIRSIICYQDAPTTSVPPATDSPPFDRKSGRGN
uniref:Uncharacterized protein n=1 Tax=Timema genevievae TaxID=629358 RepID=A0A7R9PHQ5_TIMGE|nr:unnamed protein product [Timema genevievae]